MKKIFFLLVTISTFSFAALPTALKIDIKACVQQNTNDCLKATCISASSNNCEEQCRIDAENKCKQLLTQSL